jgi:4-carboxymuconolactone decarboxylase
MASHWKCAGEWIDHEPIAISQGVDPVALEALRNGRPARFGNTDEVAVYELAQELLATREVSDETYSRARAALGERGILDVIAVLGYYSLIAMSMKTFAQKPEGAPNPFESN